jgi:hypothetical protein
LDLPWYWKAVLRAGNIRSPAFLLDLPWYWKAVLRAGNIVATGGLQEE